MNTPHPQRTRDEALRDLDYLIRLNQRHERLYARIHGSIRFAGLIAGGLALGATVSPAHTHLAIAGGLLALVGLLAFAFKPTQRLQEFTRTRQQYNAIRAQSAELDMTQIDTQSTAVEDPVYIEGLRLPSFNDTVLSHGLDSAVRPLTPWQRVMHAIA